MRYLSGSYLPAAGVQKEQLDLIDFPHITHVFIAFSVLKKEEKSGFYLPIVSDEVSAGIRLIQQAIQQQKADSKLLLSIGGAFADFFCPATRTEENRQAFADKAQALCEEFSLDGIDLDWEFPGIPHCGVLACEHCVHDFTLLCELLRKTLGNRLLTSAMGSDHWNRLENKTLSGLLDYVNIMTYDMADTDHSSMLLTKNAMEGWLAQGYSPRQLLLGVPFYGRSKDENRNWMGYDRAMKQVQEGKAQLEPSDEQNRVVFTDGSVLGLDTPDAIRQKIAYIEEKGFGGIFCWQELTDKDGELRRAMTEIFR